ncbi:hypothetical protein EXIGLDRAFT_719056 [Exidia glandulosa HHB12029]|uniref:Uncharacterized protein n=1 Tax=Exidia glandulosa HHB12029 TaxID=1314781 RepID=A0A165HCC5_EXIGL|nr:hypothetical protein EXIGLDRAFT_719056 [Exidia glandulosa HHB12029]
MRLYSILLAVLVAAVPVLTQTCTTVEDCNQCTCNGTPRCNSLTGRCDYTHCNIKGMPCTIIN